MAEALADPLALTVPQAAALLGIGHDQLYRMIRAGSFPHVRLGRKIRIRRQSIDAWLAQQEREVVAQ